VVVATSNPGKLREIEALLEDLPLSLRSLADYPDFTPPEEGDDYAENAVAKAVACARHALQLALGDDSGLEVVGLGGGPGPRSARYGGPGLDDAGRVDALLAALSGRTGVDREARFVCVVALAAPDGAWVTRRGECAGRILAARRGVAGFGYDPVFGVAGGERSMAELSPAEKNEISHRARAFRALRDELAARAA
jgi:XTP/dITP diphosphohydrolase